MPTTQQFATAATEADMADRCKGKNKHKGKGMGKAYVDDDDMPRNTGNTASSG